MNANGEIKSYNVFVKFRNLSYYNASYCNQDFQRDFDQTVSVDAGNSFVFHNAYPFATYYVQVQAVNGAEVSEWSKPETCETLPGEEFDVLQADERS